MTLRAAAMLGAGLLAAGPALALGPPGADSCSGCHVRGGGVGRLQGRPADETVAAMEAFRSGARPATLMNRIVKGFSPQEVQALAVWFASK